jgi:uncharacterized protein (DUF2252 family)
MKYAAMAGNPFVFLRGTCHLFYEDLRKESLPKSPLAWLCGDLHFENFGTYRGDNRLVYFDINDFDESCLGPCLWDIARFLTSLLVGAGTIGVKPKESIGLARQFLSGYRDSLRNGKAKWIERATAAGMVRSTMASLKNRKQKEFLAARTSRGKILTGGRKPKALPLPAGSRKTMRKFVESLGGWKFLDAARRVAGTGSLGVERYVVLVESGGGDRHLLDLKHEPGSALIPFHPGKQPEWKSEAERVVFGQHAVQAVSQAFLQAVVFEKRGFTLRELSPSQDKVELAGAKGKLVLLGKALLDMGSVTAWGELRSSGRLGAAVADDLIEFGEDEKWGKRVLAYAEHYARQVKKDWVEYRAAYKAGVFGK